MEIPVRSSELDVCAERMPRFGRSLMWLAIALQVAHILTLLILRHPLLTSNCIQLLLPIIAVLTCLARRLASPEEQSRRTWAIICAAFVIWTMAEIAYLFELYLLPQVSRYSKVDDVLWLFFAVPLLLALSGCLEGKLSRISFLDQAQATASFLVVAILVFSPSHSLSFNRAYSAQNLVLLLSCSVRYSMAASSRDRLFFRSVGSYLVTYFLCAGIGSALSHHGWQPGGMVDLFWTFPILVFCVTSLRQPSPMLPGSPIRSDQARLHTWPSHVRDLSALGLAGLSMAASAFLVLSQPVLGCSFLMASFFLLAMRTYGRSVELHSASDSLYESALTDPLTGLGNRVHLRLALESLSKEQPSGDQEFSHALLFIDLDRFKAVNDGLGHDGGDQVLIELARRIRETSQPPAIACRLGGDEFVILLKVQDEQEGRAAAARVLEVIRVPFWFNSKLLQLSASIGLVLGSNLDFPDDLLRKADQAMYEAKRMGKNRVYAFSSALQDKRAGFTLEADLRECLKNRALQVHLQPIYSLSKGQVGGFEALARWTHPELGVIPPSTFIPLAEENGCILDLGRQMLLGAIDAVARWNRATSNDAWVSVNVSTLQLLDPELLPFLLQTLASAGLDPHLMHLEITETVMLSNEQNILTMLHEARRHGIHVSLDDFGTGYSSLSYLINFPTDEIKIDRGFIRGMDKDPQRIALVRMVLQLGVSLTKRVIAEGVETEEELEILKKMGCAYVQGYLLGRPFPIASLECFTGHEARLSRIFLEREDGPNWLLLQ